MIYLMFWGHAEPEFQTAHKTLESAQATAPANTRWDRTQFDDQYTWWSVRSVRGDGEYLIIEAELKA